MDTKPGVKRSRLPEIILGVAVLAALLSIGVALWFSNARIPFAPPARIGIQLGNDWQAIQANSTYLFRGNETQSDGFASGDEQLVLIYTDPAHRLEFPVTRGIFFEFEDGRVTQVRVSQYGDIADWAATEQAVRALVGKIEQAGWTPKHSRGTLDAVLTRTRSYYDDPQNKNFMNDQFLDSWSADAARLDISLYRDHIQGDSFNAQVLPSNLYSINLSFTQND